jgi:O-antigen/teichoic acid export membrane protein
MTANTRSKRQYKHILFSFLFRGLTVLASFLIVPICLSFLSASSYGTWLVIYSILGWTAFFDLGLGNGMKNKLSEALALNDHDKAKKIVSTNYTLLFCIAILLVVGFTVIHYFIDWQKALNADNNEMYINQLIFGCFILFVVKLFLDSINNVILAHQSTSMVTLLGLASGMLALAGVYMISRMDITTPLRLPVLGAVVSGAPVIVMSLANVYLFATRFRYLRPSLDFFDKKYVRDFFTIGGQFFVIQIAAIVIFSTDSVIIARLFNTAEVTAYNIAYKLFSSFTIGWTIVITPYWVAFNEAFIKNDRQWIRKTVRMLLLLWGGMVLVIVLLLPFVDDAYKLWVGPKIKIPLSLSVGMVLFIAISTFANIFAYFVNGIAKIRLQLISSIVAAAINVPLAIFFAKHTEAGLSGIILATCVSLTIGAVLVAVQYHKIINGRATGIWNR